MRPATRLLSALLPAAVLLLAMAGPVSAGPHGGGGHFGGGVGGGPHLGGGFAPRGPGAPAFGAATMPRGGNWSGGWHGGAPPPGWHGGWAPHGGWHGSFPHNRVFIVPGGPFFFGSWGWPYYYGYPYYYPYPYPYPYYGYPTTYPPPGSPTQQYPPDQQYQQYQQYPPDSGAAPPPDAGSAPPPDEGAAPPPSSSRYGYVQLRSVPEDATVDLDGRFWVDGRQLDERWLPLTPGLHTITVRLRDSEPVDRRVDVSAGASQVVSMDSFSGERG